MTLCTFCKGIPTDFFTLHQSDRHFHYRHHMPSALRQSAAKGCPMCKILSCQLEDDWLPQEDRDTTMKRAIIDPEQGFGLWMGPDDISHNFFSIVPPTYRRLG